VFVVVFFVVTIFVVTVFVVTIFVVTLFVVTIFIVDVFVIQDWFIKKLQSRLHQIGEKTDFSKLICSKGLDFDIDFFTVEQCFSTWVPPKYF
jgi:hypothetical protein